MRKHRFLFQQILFLQKSHPDYFVFYNYIELGNNTDDTLYMHWEKTETICSNPGEPGNIWNIGIQDHVNFYNPANHLESGNFFIPTITGSTDKFLLHLFPNNLAGRLVVKFKFYPIDNPSDSVSVVYDYTVTEVVGIEDFFVENNFVVNPNPASQYFYITNQSTQKSVISIFDAHGKRLQNISLGISETEQIDCSRYPNGVYFVKIDCGGKSGLKRILVNNH